METYDPLDADHCLPNILQRRAETAPDRVFVRDLDTGLVETYGEFMVRVGRWASLLDGLGVRPGDAVVTLLPTSVEPVALWVAAARLGAVESPVNPAYRGNLLAHMVRTAGAAVVVTCREFLPQLLEVLDTTPDVARLVLVDGPVPDGTTVALPVTDWSQVAADQPEHPGRAVAPDELSCILYTSGTTGPSKGVMVTWAQTLMTVTGCFPPDGMGASDNWYVPYPLFHMSGKLCVHGAALYGGEVVLRRRFSLSGWWPDIDEHRCTTALMIGSVPQLVAGRERRADDADHALRNVEMAPMPENAGELARRFGIRLSTVFNMTEISCPVMTGWDGGAPAGSVGRQRPGYEVRIVDEWGNDVPHGTVGEIVVRSSIPHVLNAGYWRMPEKTEEAWREGWFHTGDAGYRDQDGYFYFVDRIKDAIRRGGENISSMELEAEIAEHPRVRECAAVGVPSDLGEEEVLVFLVAEDGGCSLDELYRYCRDRLPKFMVPRYYAVVDELPKTPTEKVRKTVLKDSLADLEIWDAAAAAVD